jgi:hypothetical protein
MRTPKENFLALVRNDNPQWMGDPFTCFNCNAVTGLPYILDAVALAHRRTGKGGIGVKDAWGVVWDWPEDQPGPTPNHSPDNIVIKDITRWRTILTSRRWTIWTGPKHGPWPQALTGRQAGHGAVAPGMFEFSHAMMGFEDALMNYLIEPDAMYELLEAYTDWRSRARS